MYTVGSLFTGVGGIDLAFQWAGYTIKWQVEVDDYCTRILEQHWTDVLRFRDIRGCTGRYGKGWQRYHRLPHVDVIVGGFPCQDISQAGRGAGLTGRRSGLWYEFARIISELRPRVVLLENVAALTFKNRGGTEVIGTLTEMGYSTSWGIISASDAGAPHLRKRWFCVAVAYTESQRMERLWATRQQKSRLQSKSSISGCDGAGSRTENRGAQSRVDRSIDGLSCWLDGNQINNWWQGWPMPLGKEQYDWEAPRTKASKEMPMRKKRIKALGNAVVPQVVYPLAVEIKKLLSKYEVDT